MNIIFAILFSGVEILSNESVWTDQHDNQNILKRLW